MLSIEKGAAQSGPHVPPNTKFTGNDREQRHQAAKLLWSYSLRKAIDEGLMADPDVPRRLEDAITVVGTCDQMCPEMEIAQRSLRNEVHILEYDSGRWAPEYMIKMFRRPDAGAPPQQPMDLRPPSQLKITLEYLIALIDAYDDELRNIHEFIWDRTRAIRNDFSIQRVRDLAGVKIAIWCFERIFRFHLLTLHQVGGKPKPQPDHSQVKVKEDLPEGRYSHSQDMEQGIKALLSLLEYYEHAHDLGYQPPNEPEFQAYWIITRIPQQSVRARGVVERTINNWPIRLQQHPRIVTALELFRSAYNSTDFHGRNGVVGMQNYERFWMVVESSKCTYLMAAAAEISFDIVRKVALFTAAKAYSRGRRTVTEYSAYDVQNELLHFDNADDTLSFIRSHNMQYIEIDDFREVLDLSGGKNLDYEMFSQHTAPRLQYFSESLVERKRYGRKFSAIIHGYGVWEADELGLVEHNEHTRGLFDDTDDEVDSETGGDAITQKPEPVPIEQRVKAVPRSRPLASRVNAQQNPQIANNGPPIDPALTSQTQSGLFTQTPFSFATQAPSGVGSTPQFAPASQSPFAFAPQAQPGNTLQPQPGNASQPQPGNSSQLQPALDSLEQSGLRATGQQQSLPASQAPSHSIFASGQQLTSAAPAQSSLVFAAPQPSGASLPSGQQSLPDSQALSNPFQSTQQPVSAAPAQSGLVFAALQPSGTFLPSGQQSLPDSQALSNPFQSTQQPLTAALAQSGFVFAAPQPWGALLPSGQQPLPANQAPSNPLQSFQQPLTAASAQSDSIFALGPRSAFTPLAQSGPAFPSGQQFAFAAPTQPAISPTGQQALFATPQQAQPLNDDMIINTEVIPQRDPNSYQQLQPSPAYTRRFSGLVYSPGQKSIFAPEDEPGYVIANPPSSSPLYPVDISQQTQTVSNEMDINNVPIPPRQPGFSTPSQPSIFLRRPFKDNNETDSEKQPEAVSNVMDVNDPKWFAAFEHPPSVSPKQSQPVTYHQFEHLSNEMEVNDPNLYAAQGHARPVYGNDDGADLFVPLAPPPQPPQKTAQPATASLVPSPAAAIPLKPVFLPEPVATVLVAPALPSARKESKTLVAAALPPTASFLASAVPASPSRREARKADSEDYLARELLLGIQGGLLHRFIQNEVSAFFDEAKMQVEEEKAEEEARSFRATQLIRKFGVWWRVATVHRRKKRQAAAKRQRAREIGEQRRKEEVEAEAAEVARKAQEEAALKSSQGPSHSFEEVTSEAERILRESHGADEAGTAPSEDSHPPPASVRRTYRRPPVSRLRRQAATVVQPRSATPPPQPETAEDDIWRDFVPPSLFSGLPLRNRENWRRYKGKPISSITSNYWKMKVAGLVHLTDSYKRVMEIRKRVEERYFPQRGLGHKTTIPKERAASPSGAALLGHSTISFASPPPQTARQQSPSSDGKRKRESSNEEVLELARRKLPAYWSRQSKFLDSSQYGLGSPAKRAKLGNDSKREFQRPAKRSMEDEDSEHSPESATKRARYETSTSKQNGTITKPSSSKPTSQQKGKFPASNTKQPPSSSAGMAAAALAHLSNSGINENAVEDNLDSPPNSSPGLFDEEDIDEEEPDEDTVEEYDDDDVYYDDEQNDDDDDDSHTPPAHLQGGNSIEDAIEL
ncbi:hypothetical protein BT63DRAFT_251966 [Microthyrium microscopicum]|uniref:SAC3/GANP/THP3 conserved domain-containing protein n=1 Tax=Microthyrium microscopicum TaxID=703497 RepID=A0A6A6UA81_9PEZI|nr:hypothetical protein BT63DRAFT_251966 [Microthyrium microscopicum]